MSHFGSKEGPSTSIPLQYIHLHIPHYWTLIQPFLELKPLRLGTCPSCVPFPSLWWPNYLQHSHVNRYIPSFPTTSASIWTTIGHPEDEGITFLRNVGNTYYMAQKTNRFTIGLKPSNHTYLPNISPVFPQLLRSQNFVSDYSSLQWVADLILS
jgi:hypothetical protein